MKSPQSASARALAHGPVFYRDSLALFALHGWNAEEIGVWFVLRCRQWVNGYLPADERTLAKQCTASVAAVRSVVAACYPKVGTGQRAYRADPELERQRDLATLMYENAVEAGKAGARKRWQGNGRKSKQDTTAISRPTRVTTGDPTRVTTGDPTAPPNSNQTLSYRERESGSPADSSVHGAGSADPDADARPSDHGMPEPGTPAYRALFPDYPEDFAMPADVLPLVPRPVARPSLVVRS